MAAMTRTAMTGDGAAGIASDKKHFRFSITDNARLANQ